MNDFPHKIGLIDTLKIELSISKSEFVRILQNNIDESDSDFGDIFSSSKNQYKGIVNLDGFELKSKATFFTSQMNFAKAKGIFSHENNHLVIDTEINGFSGKIKFLYSVLFIFYPIFIAGFFFADNNESKLFIIPFLLIHATLMITIPYFTAKRSVSRLKYDLERDFYFMIRK